MSLEEKIEGDEAKKKQQRDNEMRERTRLRDAKTSARESAKITKELKMTGRLYTILKELKMTGRKNFREF